ILLVRLRISDLRLGLRDLVIKVSNRVRRVLALLPQGFPRQILSDLRRNQRQVSLPELRERLRSLSKHKSHELPGCRHLRLACGNRSRGGIEAKGAFRNGKADGPQRLPPSTYVWNCSHRDVLSTAVSC